MPYIHPAPPTITLFTEDGKTKARVVARLPIIHRCDMQSLIDAFPALRAKDLVWLPGEDSRPFRKRVRARCFSHGEQVLARFVLHVWNHHDHVFKLGEAVGCLSEINLAGIQAWLLDPWYM